ncbi:MAG: SDR family oxidoreductase [Bacteroidota bacterium]
MKRFANQVALITGAGKGIGFEIALQLAREGARVILNDIDEALAAKASQQIRAQNGICEWVAGDSGALSCIQEMVSLAIQKFGHVDIAIANAGITTFGSFLEYTEAEFQRLIQVNLQGSFFLAQRAAQQMVAQESGGRILLMSSVTGHQHHPNLAAYGMSKAAIRYLAKHLGVELAPHGITVNAISPGATLTERTRIDESGNFRVLWEKITPTGKCATTQDIAHTALFFLSPQASQITGQTLIVDGGWTAYSPPPGEE